MSSTFEQLLRRLLPALDRRSSEDTSRTAVGERQGPKNRVAARRSHPGGRLRRRTLGAGGGWSDGCDDSTTSPHNPFRRIPDLGQCVIWDIARSCTIVTSQRGWCVMVTAGP